MSPTASPSVPRTFRAIIDAAAAAGGSQPFLVGVETQDTAFHRYRQLVHATAGAWAAIGVKPRTHVAIYLPSSVEYLVAFHALMVLGAVMIPLNVHYRSAELEYLLSHSESVVLLTTSDLYEAEAEPVRARLPMLQDLVLLDREDTRPTFRDLVSRELECPVRAVSETAPAVILYTSGTTARPKGCIIAQYYYAENAVRLANAIGLDENAVHMTVLPLFHVNAQIATLASLIARSRLVVRERFRATQFWKDVVDNDVTHAGHLGSIVPVLDTLADPRERTTTLRVFWGAGLSADAQVRLEPRWGVRFLELYGTSETGTDLANPLGGERRPGSCGLPLPGRDVRIVDEGGRPVPPRASGELVVRITAAVAQGYWREEAASAETFRDGWVHTGDMAYMDEDGYVYFQDRKKDVIRRSGENVASAEVEAVLRAHPAVVDAACVAVADEVRGEEVKAIVVLRESLGGANDVGPDEIARFCEERIAYFKVPRFIEYRKELPRTATTKIVKAALRAEHGMYPCFDRERCVWLGRDR